MVPFDCGFGRARFHPWLQFQIIRSTCNPLATPARCGSRRSAWKASGSCLASRALVVGCGALGSVIANTLARAGVGKLRIVDRDFLELNNLQRQVLYDEDDVAAGLPKAIAAKNRLAKINSQIEIDADRGRRRSHEHRAAARGRRLPGRRHRQF